MNPRWSFESRSSFYSTSIETRLASNSSCASDKYHELIGPTSNRQRKHSMKFAEHFSLRDFQDIVQNASFYDEFDELFETAGIATNRFRVACPILLTAGSIAPTPN